MLEVHIEGRPSRRCGKVRQRIGPLALLLTRLPLLRTLLLLSMLVGCDSGDPARTPVGGGSTMDGAVSPDGGENLDGSSTDRRDAGADAGDSLCHAGWSGSPECCLENAVVSAGAGGCPPGYYPASACGRVDSVCEGIDAGHMLGDDGGDHCPPDPVLDHEGDACTVEGTICDSPTCASDLCDPSCHRIICTDGLSDDGSLQWRGLEDPGRPAECGGSPA